MVCPNCEIKIKIDYTHKRQPATDGIYLASLRVPGFVGAGNRIVKTHVSVSICNNCKVILGTGVSS